MKPYYEEGGITIYHGDCREVLPSIKADVLVTDPPYGVNLGHHAMASETRQGFIVKGSYRSYEDTPENFRTIVVPVIQAALAMTKRGLVFSNGTGLQDLPRYSALGGVFIPVCCARTCWGFQNFSFCALYGTAPLLHLGAKCTGIVSTESAEPSLHPCPKPYGWMTWAVLLATEPTDIVLDPFCGSGVTLQAAKNLGRKAIGIEIDEKYCEVAAKRLAQGVLNFSEEAS